MGNKIIREKERQWQRQEENKGAWREKEFLCIYKIVKQKHLLMQNERFLNILITMRKFFEINE